MLKILLPLLILFSMSSLAGLPLEPSYAAPDYLESESVMIARTDNPQACKFERCLIAAIISSRSVPDNNAELEIINASNLSLKPELKEVGWDKRPGI